MVLELTLAQSNVSLKETTISVLFTNHISSLFVSLGTHYYWENNGTIERDICQTLLHRTESDNWNKSPFDLKSFALNTQLYMVTFVTQICGLIKAQVCRVNVIRENAKKKLFLKSGKVRKIYKLKEIYNNLKIG